MNHFSSLPRFYYAGTDKGGPDKGPTPPAPPVPPPPPKCPEVMTARLIDVAKAGNYQLAVGLPTGSLLGLVPDSNTFRVEFSGQPLGWLPLDIARVLNPCIAQGVQYVASLFAVNNSLNPTRIEVRIEQV